MNHDIKCIIMFYNHSMQAEAEVHDIQCEFQSGDDFKTRSTPWQMKY